MLLPPAGDAAAGEASALNKKSSRREDPSPAMSLLQANCFGCHNDEKKKGGLVMNSREALLRGGDNGPAIVAGKPEASLLVRVLGADADPHMPPKKQLSKDEIRLVQRWVKSGAPWDAASLLAAEERIQPVRLQPLPSRFRPILALGISPDDHYLAVARGNQLALHDVTATNIAVIRQVEAHLEDVQALAWSPDGRWLASGGFRRVVIWEAESMRRERELTNGLVGRVTALRFSQDGSNVVAADSLAAQRGFIRILDPGTGTIRASWPAHADTIHGLDLTRDGKLLATAGGDKMVKVWRLESHQEMARLEGHSAAVLGVAFNSNATQVVSGGADKELKVWDVATREKVIALGRPSAGISAVAWQTNGHIMAANEAGTVLSYSDLKVHSGEQSSSGGNERKVADGGEALLCLAVTRDGSRIFAGQADGVVRAWKRDGKELAKLEPPATSDSTLGTNATKAVAAKARKSAPAPLSFVRDVLPVLSKAGCNAGACHAKPEGQNGFRLTVFSFDPKSDHAEITREGRSRRVFPAAPEESLILKKPTLGVPHEGGERFKRGSASYELVARWIREGMVYQLPDEPALSRIEVTPGERLYRKGARQRLRVQAHYSDGSSRDVTHLSSFDTNDKEMARVDERGQLTVGNLTGQGAIVARFMGFVADSKITVPADRLLPASKYAALPVNNFIDELAYAHFKKLGLFPSPLSNDGEFLRRASLDTIGLLPTPEEARAFVASDTGDSAAKRQGLITRLLDHPAYADYWANKFADLLRPNPDRVGVKSVFTLDQWLRESFRENKPYDQFVRDILTAEGSNHRYGPAVVYRDRREPADLTTMFSQLFLGVRLECARCHHHPNEKWGQEDFYQFAAFFGPVKQKGAGLSPPISAGTETFYFAGGGTVKHPVTGAVMPPKPPDGEAPAVEDGSDPRDALAEWLTRPGNPFFAKAIVNRVWANFFGRGFVEPVDDFRISNPCVNQPLLDALAADFAEHRFDLKHLMRTILESRLYQLSSEPNETNLADTRNFSRSYRRRLPAEVLSDAVNDITGVPDTSSALPAGFRSTQMWSYKIDSQLLDAFGRPNSSSDCPCERDSRTSVVQALHLMHSKNLQGKLAGEKGRVKQLASSDRPPREIVTELYLAALSRMPTETELGVATAVFANPDTSRQAATEDVLWALLNSAEFVFNH